MDHQSGPSHRPMSESASSSSPRSKITRRRTGCIPCRDRHVRCDEQKPCCRRCERTASDCVWIRDVRIVFHNPNDVASRRTSESSAAAAAPVLFGPDEEWTTLSPSSLHTHDLANLRPMDTVAGPVLEYFTDWASLDASDLIQNAFRTNLELKIMQNYLTEVAPWFDAHTGKQYYSRSEVSRMLSCPPWRAAAMALSAKNIELRERCSVHPGSEPLPLHLYQLAVRLAIDAMSGRFETVGALAGCVLLCVYEMMTVTYTDWRRHVQGCASIYTHHKWNGSSGGLISGSFWDYARIDIWAAFCASSRTMMSPAGWFDDPDAILHRTEMDEDLHSQVAIWLTARVINLVSDDGSAILGEGFYALRTAMQRWPDMGGPATRPVILCDADALGRTSFPGILFSTHSSTIGHTMWNSAMVLLLEFEASTGPAGSIDQVPDLSHRAYQHALRALGIIETNNHNACLVNSLQPSFICGRHMRTESEKSATLDLLAQIERKTGWRCGWRSDELRGLWNSS